MMNYSTDGKSAYDIVKEYPHCPIKIPSGATSMTSATIDFERVQDAIIAWYEREKGPDVGRHRDWPWMDYGRPGRDIFQSPQFPPLDNNDWPDPTSYINAAKPVVLDEMTEIDMDEFKKKFKRGFLPGLRAFLEGAAEGASIRLNDDPTKEYDFYFSESQARFFSRSNEVGLYQIGGNISYNVHRRLYINGQLFTFCIEKGQKHEVSWEDLRYLVLLAFMLMLLWGIPGIFPTNPLSDLLH